MINFYMACGSNVIHFFDEYTTELKFYIEFYLGLDDIELDNIKRNSKYILEADYIKEHNRIRYYIVEETIALCKPFFVLGYIVNHKKVIQICNKLDLPTIMFNEGTDIFYSWLDGSIYDEKLARLLFELLNKSRLNIVLVHLTNLNLGGKDFNNDNHGLSLDMRFDSIAFYNKNLSLRYDAFYNMSLYSYKEDKWLNLGKTTRPAVINNLIVFLVGTKQEIFDLFMKNHVTLTYSYILEYLYELLDYHKSTDCITFTLTVKDKEIVSNLDLTPSLKDLTQLYITEYFVNKLLQIGNIFSIGDKKRKGLINLCAKHTLLHKSVTVIIEINNNLDILDFSCI